MGEARAIYRPGGAEALAGAKQAQGERRQPRPVWFAVLVRSEIEAVDSYARRVGDAVRVVLTLPDDVSSEVGDSLSTAKVWLRFSHQVDGEREGFRVPVEVTPGARPRLVADVPSEQATPGTWHLALRVGQGGPLVALEARLLVTDTARQPLALLAGPRPQTRLPEPAPR